MTGRSGLIHFAGLTLAVIAMVYFGSEMAGLWSQSSTALRQPEVLGSMSAAAVFLVGGYLVSAMAWREICLAMGVGLGLAAAARIYFISQFGKYLPGNVGHHAGRWALSLRANLPGPVIVASQALEMLMVVGLFSAVGLMSGASNAGLWIPQGMASAQVLLPTGVAVLALAAIATPILMRTQRVSRFVEMLATMIAWPRSAVHLARAAALMGVNLAAATVALYVIAAAVGGAGSVTAAGMCFTFVVSWMAGFLTPGAPAGLGVRETVMLTFLSHSMPMAEAAATCLAFRVVTTATDLLVFLVGLRIPSRARA